MIYSKRIKWRTRCLSRSRYWSWTGSWPWSGSVSRFGSKSWTRSFSGKGNL